MPSQRPWQLSRMNGDNLTYLQRPLCSEMRKHVRGCNTALEVACRRSVQLSYRKLHLMRDKIERRQSDVYRTMLEVDCAKQVLRAAKKSAVAAFLAAQQNTENGISPPPTSPAAASPIPTQDADAADADVAIDGLQAIVSESQKDKGTTSVNARNVNHRKTVEENDSKNINSISTHENSTTENNDLFFNPSPVTAVHIHGKDDTKLKVSTIESDSDMKIHVTRPSAKLTRVSDISNDIQSLSAQSNGNCAQLADNNNSNSSKHNVGLNETETNSNRQVRRSVSEVGLSRKLRASKKLSSVSLPNTGIEATIMEESTILELPVPRSKAATSPRTPRLSAIAMYNSNDANNYSLSHPVAPSKGSSGTTGSSSARMLSSTRESQISNAVGGCDVSNADDVIVEYMMTSEGKLVRSALPYKRQVFFTPPDPASYDDKKSALLACEERNRRHSVAKMSAFIRSISVEDEMPVPFSRQLPSISPASVKAEHDVDVGLALRDVMRAFHPSDLYPQGVDPASIEAIKYCRYIRSKKPMSLV